MNKYVIILLFLLFNMFFGSASYNPVIPGILLLGIGLVGLWVNRVFEYKNIFWLYFVGIFCSLVSCKYFRGQSFIESLKVLPYFLGICFYFLLKNKKVTPQIVEKSLLILIWIFDVLYIAQYYLLPYGYNFLGIDDWMIKEGSELGGTRLRVMSSGLYIVGLFYGLSKWYITKQKKYLPLFLLGVFIMLLTGYRQFIASLFVTIFFMFYIFDRKITVKQWKYMVGFSFIAFFLLMIPAVQEKILGMQERNALGQNLTDDDYIRVAQFYFFTNDYFTDGVEYFFGSGIPFPNSSFGKWFENYHLLGMQYVDWGIIGVSWVLGILTAVAIVLFFLKGIRLKVDKEHKYLCLYLFFLLTTCITNWEMFRNGNFLVHAIVLYLIEQAHIKYKSNQLANVSQK